MKALLLSLFITISTAHAADVQLVKVYKSARKLELIGANNKVIKTYKVMLGRNPIGHKAFEGDNKTPEGTYTLDEKNPNSNFYKSLHISYPNFKDKLKAKSRGKSPGGDIMLHGMPNDFRDMMDFVTSVGLADLGDDLIRSGLLGYDWTNGCIAVTDSEIEEIYSMINVPTKITIFP